MRVIKFRAWDIDTKEAVNLSSRTQLVLRLNGKITEGSTTPNVILEQFTGILDNKSVDVYEGDIASVCTNGGDENCVCRWSDEYARFQWQDISGSYVYQMQEVDSIVIGNIHENPELLK
jgi:hypothetical protein